MIIIRMNCRGIWRRWRSCRGSGPIGAWVTTLKDWVKLRGRVGDEGGEGGVPIYYVRIECQLAGRHRELFRTRLEQLCRSRQEPVSVR